MHNLKIVVDNTESVISKVLMNFKECAPKKISIFHAIRNVDSLQEGLDAVDELVRAELVEMEEITAPNGQILRYYRYCGEHFLERNYDEIYPIHNNS